MSIILSSANGLTAKKFIEEFDIYKKAGAIDDSISIEDQTPLAGPNENLQLLFDGMKLLEDIKGELVGIAVTKLFEKRKFIFQKVARYFSASIDFLFNVQKNAPSNLSIILGIKSKNADVRNRNFGFDLRQLELDDIEKRMLLLSVYGQDIKEYIELIQSKHNNENSIEWKFNEDFSIAIFLEDFMPYLEYKEINYNGLGVKEVKILFNKTSVTFPPVQN